jgi:hypothetical protein
MSSFVSATGLNGGGDGPQPADAAALQATTITAMRIHRLSFMIDDLHYFENASRTLPGMPFHSA